MDTLQRFIFEHAEIRGDLVHLRETYQTIVNQHPYPKAIRALLGEALVAIVLIAGSIKFEGKLSLQFQGDERLPLLLVQCDHQLHVRGFAKFNGGDEVDFESAFLGGKMTLTVNQYKQTQAYQSVLPIVSASMSDNLMSYFALSEQIPTKVWLATSEHQVSGILLQLMPGQNTSKREEFWEYAVHIGETITANELLTLDNETILYRLYHETELRLFDPRPVEFQCQCHVDKMKQVLVTLGQKEIESLLAERGKVEVHCDFCNTVYDFDSIDVAMLFRK